MTNPRHFKLGVDYIPDWAMIAISENRLILNRDANIESPFDHNHKTNAFIYEDGKKEFVKHGDYIILDCNEKLIAVDEKMFEELYLSDKYSNEKDKLISLIGNLKENEYVVIYQFNANKGLKIIICGDKHELRTIASTYNNKLLSKCNMDRVVHVSKTDNLSEYFKPEYQVAISNRIYEITGIKFR